MIESPLSHFFRVHSIAGVLTKTFTLSGCFGFLLGYFLYRLRRSAGAPWVWTAGVCWLLAKCVGVLLHSKSGSVLEVQHESFWGTISGAACREPSLAYCADWMMFPLLALRTFAYSAGAAVCAKLGHTGPHWMVSGFTGRVKWPDHE